MNSFVLQINLLVSLRDALRNLVLFVQFKKRKKHPWRSVSVFHVFLNCTSDIKSSKASHIMETLFLNGSKSCN